MEKNSLLELEQIVNNATDAIEYKLVVASLISMIGKLSFDSRYDLINVLESLLRDFNSKMTIEAARRKSKAAITGSLCDERKNLHRRVFQFQCSN